MQENVRSIREARSSDMIGRWCLTGVQV